MCQISLKKQIKEQFPKIYPWWSQKSNHPLNLGRSENQAKSQVCPPDLGMSGFESGINLEAPLTDD